MRPLWSPADQLALCISEIPDAEVDELRLLGCEISELHLAQPSGVFRIFYRLDVLPPTLRPLVGLDLENEI
jgi:hypothetical protein